MILKWVHCRLPRFNILSRTSSSNKGYVTQAENVQIESGKTSTDAPDLKEWKALVPQDGNEQQQQQQEEEQNFLQQAWKNPNETICVLHSPDHSSNSNNTSKKLSTGRSLTLETCSSDTDTNAFELQLQEALDEAFKHNNTHPAKGGEEHEDILPAAGCCPKTEELLKCRLSGKVFPSQRAAAAAAAAVIAEEAVDQQQERGLGQQAAAATAASSSSSASTRACNVEAGRSNNFKVRRVKCFFPVLRSPSKWKWWWWCSCRKSTHIKWKRISFRKLLIKFRKKVWSPCLLSNNGSNLPESIPAARGIQHSNVAIKLSSNTGSEQQQQQQPNVTDGQHHPVPQPRVSSERDRPFLRRAPSSPDPEYWINTDSDYVVLVVSNATKNKDEGDK